MLINPSGYLISLKSDFIPNDRAMVIGPILPKYMQIVIKIFDTTESLSVIPRLAPTVAKADDVSYKMSIKAKSSKAAITKLTNITIDREITNIDKAFLIVSLLILLLKTTGSLSFFFFYMTARINTTKVVVLIPPAVDPGDPPINMRLINSMAVESLIFDKSVE